MAFAPSTLFREHLVNALWCAMPTGTHPRPSEEFREGQFDVAIHAWLTHARWTKGGFYDERRRTLRADDFATIKSYVERVASDLATLYQGQPSDGEETACWSGALNAIIRRLGELTTGDWAEFDRVA